MSFFCSARSRFRRPAAISSAALQAASSSLSSGTTSTTRPFFFAALALIGFDVRIILIPCSRPTSRGRRWVPPNPGMMPSCNSGSPNLDLGVQTRPLHARATSQPPPRATPRTAATVGLSPFSRRAVSTALTSPKLSPLGPLANWEMSNPALKALFPAPAITTALTSALACSSCIVEAKSRRTGEGCRRRAGRSGGVGEVSGASRYPPRRGSKISWVPGWRAS